MKAKLIAVFALGLLGAPFAANAIPVTFNYTADNLLSIWGECAGYSCQYPANAYAPGPNSSDWRTADSLTLNLGPGTYSFAFFAQNSGAGSSSNPGGFLAEILWGGNAFGSSSAWNVSVCPDSNPNNCDFGGWVSATEYGQNGGANIWTANNGSNPVSGIGTEANWIWSDANFSSSMDQYVVFRATFTVPEPSSLALLGLGLVGLGLASRRRKAR